MRLWRAEQVQTKRSTRTLRGTKPEGDMKGIVHLDAQAML